MSITFKPSRTGRAAFPPDTKKMSGHIRPGPLTFVRLDDDTACLRVSHLLTLFSIAHATFYDRRKSGKIPPPDGHIGNHPYWTLATVKKIPEGAAAVRAVITGMVGNLPSKQVIGCGE